MRIALALFSIGLLASAHAASPLSRAFEQAWQRQPYAASSELRQQAVLAQQQAALALNPERPSLALGTRSDRFNNNQGARELEMGLIVPLWLPGEQEGVRTLADAQNQALAGRMANTRLDLARQVRDAWWNWQAARNEHALAQGRLSVAQRLGDDVARRFRAGDLSRADWNQAQGLVAQARVQAAEADARRVDARFSLESLTGPLAPGDEDGSETEPEPQEAVPNHPRLQDLQGQKAVAEQQAELARLRIRSNPELSVSTRSERSAAGLANDQTWAVALRFAIGGGPRHSEQVATATASAVEAEVALLREHERLAQAQLSLRSQKDAVQAQLRAAQERHALAQENRGFYEKSFRLGESDLPTRLRIEAEAFEAERILSATRIQYARILSQLRQVLGLLPE